MNPQSRKWQITINNPLEHNLTHEVLIEILHKFAPDYIALADEVASTGTYHTHIFLYSSSPIRFSTLKNRLPLAHIEKAFGSIQENRDYITKSGRWADTEKAETSVENTFYEYGTPPTEKEEESPLICTLIEALKNSESTAKIIENNPKLAFKVREIELLRQALYSEYKGAEFRQLTVTYLYGASGIGKTQSIYTMHPTNEICRITNYRQGKQVYFDSYAGQDILVFDDYFSQIPLAEFKNYLVGLPITLPARYSDRVACYTKVYILSTIPLEEQYIDIQQRNVKLWNSLLNCIHQIIEYKEDGSIIIHKQTGGINHERK